MRSLVLMTMLFAMMCSSVFAQFPEDLDYERRYLIFGGQFYSEEYAVNGTVVVPEKVGDFEGFTAAHVNKVGDKWLAVGRIEGGLDIVADWSLNVFSELKRDQFAGADSFQVGFFAESPRIEVNDALFTFGAGNFVDNEQAQEDLGLKASDERVVRALVYGNMKYKTFNLLVKGTPNAQFWTDASDLQIEIQPTLKLAKDLSLMALLGFDSDPIRVDDENWRVSGGIQLEKSF